MIDFGEPWMLDSTVIRDRDLWVIPHRNKRLAESDHERILACINALASIRDPAKQVERWKAMEVALKRAKIESGIRLDLGEFAERFLAYLRNTPPEQIAGLASEWTPDE